MKPKIALFMILLVAIIASACGPIEAGKAYDEATDEWSGQGSLEMLLQDKGAVRIETPGHMVYFLFAKKTFTIEDSTATLEVDLSTIPGCLADQLQVNYGDRPWIYDQNGNGNFDPDTDPFVFACVKKVK